MRNPSSGCPPHHHHHHPGLHPRPATSINLPLQSHRHVTSPFLQTSHQFHIDAPPPTPSSLCRTARPPPPPLAPHPSASHFQAASGVTRGLHGSLSRSDSLVSAPSMQSVREMSSRWKWRLVTGGSSVTIMDDWLEAPSARCLSVHLKKHLVRRPESDSRAGFRQVTTVVSACILMNQRGGKKTPANKQKGGFYFLNYVCLTAWRLQCSRNKQQSEQPWVSQAMWNTLWLTFIQPI